METKYLMKDAFECLKDYFTVDQLKTIKEDYLILIKENDEGIEEWDNLCKDKKELYKIDKAILNLEASVIDDAKTENEILKELIKYIDEEIALHERQVEEMLEANKKGQRYIF